MLQYCVAERALRNVLCVAGQFCTTGSLLKETRISPFFTRAVKDGEGEKGKERKLRVEEIEDDCGIGVRCRSEHILRHAVSVIALEGGIAL